MADMQSLLGKLISVPACADQLSCLTATDVYRYMSQEHDATTMGLLLGMAAAKAGTMDPVVSKMLFMHAPSLSPEAFLELELSPMVQSAALLGLGLLFRGSCHRCIFLHSTHVIGSPCTLLSTVAVCSLTSKPPLSAIRPQLQVKGASCAQADGGADD